jgi:hypothetical protein
MKININNIENGDSCPNGHTRAKRFLRQERIELLRAKSRSLLNPRKQCLVTPLLITEHQWQISSIVTPAKQQGVWNQYEY